MWFVLEKLALERGVNIGNSTIIFISSSIPTGNTDAASSFFVGDAAGRPSDFAGTDRKWAENLGMPFYTPEVCA